MSSHCDDCNAGFGTVGVRKTGDIPYLCTACLRREGIEEAFSDPAIYGGTAGLITEECDALRDLLHEKNRKYGDSALNPVRIVSRADAELGIRVRIDDKLSRLKSGQPDEDEDVLLDLTGYLILLRVARRLRGSEP